MMVSIVDLSVVKHFVLFMANLSDSYFPLLADILWVETFVDGYEAAARFTSLHIIHLLLRSTHVIHYICYSLHMLLITHGRCM